MGIPMRIKITAFVLCSVALVTGDVIPVDSAGTALKAISPATLMSNTGDTILVMGGHPAFRTGACKDAYL